MSAAGFDAVYYRRPFAVFVAIMAIVIATLMFMGLFIYSSLDLDLNSRLQNRLDTHMDTQVWHTRLLMEQGVPFSRVVHDILSISFATEPALMRMMVLDADGTIRYSSEGSGIRLLSRILAGSVAPWKGRTIIYNKDAGWYQGTREIPGSGGSPAGTFIFLYRVTGIAPVLDSALLVMFVVAGSLILSGILVFFAGPPIVGRIGKGRRRRLTLRHLFMSWNMKGALILISAIIGFFSLFITLSYASMVSDAELLAAKNQLGNLSSMVRQLKEVEPDYRYWGDMDTFLQEILLAQNSSHYFYICDKKGTLLWGASRESRASITGGRGQEAREPQQKTDGDPVHFGLGTGIEVLVPGKNGQDLLVGVRPDSESINRAWQSALIDLLSILAIVFMLSVEVLRLLRSRMRSTPDRAAATLVNLEAASAESRFFVFLLFVALFLPFSTFPQQALEWLGRNQAASGPWLLTLTVSSWLLGVAMVSLSSRFFMKRMSFERLATGSIILVIFLFAANLLVSHIFLMLALRLMSGFVHGCVAMLACGSDCRNVIMVPAGRTRYLDIREWNAGFASGAIVGIGSGGILGARFGLELVGMASMVVLGGILFYISRRRPFTGFVPYIAGIGLGFLKKTDPRKLMRFFGLLILVFLPLQLATQGLFYFLFPLYMTNLGLSYADIARMLAGYGCIGLLTPVWKRIVQGYRQERMFIIASHMVCGISIIAFVLQQDLASLMVAALSMGVAAMLNDGISYRLVLKQPGILDSREDPEPWYRLTEMMSAAFIPLVGAVLAVALGIREAVFIIGICSLAGSVMFTFFAGYGRKGKGWN